MRILHFGTFSTGPGYPRNRVLAEGLRRNGVDVVPLNEDFWRDAADKISGVSGGRGLLRAALRYARAWAKLAVRHYRAPSCDAVLVGYTGQADVFLARALSAGSGRPVILDAFLSLHDTIVRDRKLARADGAAAALLRLLDRDSCRVADLVLLDTEAHADWFAAFTRLPRRKFAVVPVGEDDRAFPPAPLPARDGALRVLWFGTFVPLQGVDIVLGAAARLRGEPVQLRMVGRGQQFPEFRSRAEQLPNVSLLPRWVSYEELYEEIRSADVCLGVFGTTGKAGRVVPCKVWDALAVGRPVITADTPAAREILTDGVSALLVPQGDPAALSAAVRRLVEDEGLRRRIAVNGREVYLRRGSPDAVGRALLGHLAPLCR